MRGPTASDKDSAPVGALEIIEDFVGSSFFILLILVGAGLLLTGFYALRNLL